MAIKKFLVFQSHPIQYFSPLYKSMVDGGMDVKVHYYTKHGLNNEYDVEFKSKVKWDLPLLEGYESDFLDNDASKPSIYSFFGCKNWSVFTKIKQAEDALVLVYGWKYFSDVLVMLAAIFYGKKLCLRTETPWSQEKLNGSLKARIKRTVLRYLIFPFVHNFFYIGAENKEFYCQLGVDDRRLVFVPYSVDNDRFSNDYVRLAGQKEKLREEMGIPKDKFVFLFSGKLIPKKRPMDLLKAFALLKDKTSYVVFLGEGELRSEMETFIEEEKVEDIKITGFINQSEIGKYYALSDAFVMCSESGETWGLSTNEAMIFHLPIVLSELTGSSSDLVHVEDPNGYVFETANVQDLSGKLHAMNQLPDEHRKEMGERSAEIIKTYSYDTIVKNLKAL